MSNKTEVIEGWTGPGRGDGLIEALSPMDDALHIEPGKRGKYEREGQEAWSSGIQAAHKSTRLGPHRPTSTASCRAHRGRWELLPGSHCGQSSCPACKKPTCWGRSGLRT